MSQELVKWIEMVSYIWYVFLENLASQWSIHGLYNPLIYLNDLKIPHILSSYFRSHPFSSGFTEEDFRRCRKQTKTGKTFRKKLQRQAVWVGPGGRCVFFSRPETLEKCWIFWWPEKNTKKKVQGGPPTSYNWVYNSYNN